MLYFDYINDTCVKWNWEVMKTKIYLIFVFLFIFIAYLFFEYQNNNDKELIKESFIQKAKSTFYEKDDLLNGYTHKLENILISLRDNHYFQNYLSTNENQKYIKELFLSSMKSTPEIFQLRYINISGDEDIRVDKSNDSYVIVENKKLQNKKHRYYFTQTLNKSYGDIWYSNIDLNVEHNKIVKPIQPTLRIGTPVEINGDKKGILILNINIEYFFNKFIKSSNYNIYVVDKDGYFIKHAKNDKYSWSKYLKTDKSIYNTLNLEKKIDIKNELITDGFYINNTTFKNNDDVRVVIELKRSQIEDEIKEKRISRVWYLLGSILLILLVGYVAYSRKYTYLLETHNKEMDEERKKIRNILDSQNSIVILTDGKHIVDGNKRFLDFFDFESIERFKEKHDCICEYFEADDKYEYLQEEVNGKVWALYVLLNPNKTHKAKMTDAKGETHIFIVNIKEYDAKNSIEIITFSDVTELEFLKNNLEDTVCLKTEELRDLNQNLEACIKTEVEKNREKEKQLFEREKMAQMGEMIGNIAHQWRQPLSTISTCASGMQMQDELGLLDSENLHENLDMIVSTSQFLSDTIDDFRDFINEDKSRKLFNISDTIDQVVKIIKDTYLHNFIELKVQKVDKEIDSIPGEVSQVLLNILNNAKDILVEKKISSKWVELKTISEDDRIIITIEDNGGGVPEDILPKIFDPYFTTKHQSAGTGIGLYMSHKIVTKNLKGHLYVKNTSAGAKFFIELPITY